MNAILDQIFKTPGTANAVNGTTCICVCCCEEKAADGGCRCGRESMLFCHCKTCKGNWESSAAHAEFDAKMAPFATKAVK
jgi:hypothetical protein